ncbi:hypothetical protein [Phenylobacterium sp.]|uniref:hypothetical protein n=1 Tax=Phenylobacterium sp. TaxID=1871053 RepID=UPI0025E1F4D6|nr:hypothetical protein [Phenylobacterium sp.]
MPALKHAAIGAALAALLAAASAHAQPPPVIGIPPQTAPAAGGCAPTGLFRAVVRNVTPGLAAADRAAQPRTLWRQGAKYLRSEEQPDPASGSQGVFIVAEPDIWVLDQSTRSGQHSTDPGPELEVRAPILPPSLDTPAPFRTLEFGCEGAFVAAYAPRAQRFVPWGTTVAGLHAVTLGDHSLAILMDDRRGAPLMISYIRQGRPVLVLRYDDYRGEQPERPGVFAPPKGFQITEAKGQPPPLKLN